MKEDQIARAEAFRALHQSAKLLVLYNVWDAGSAAAVEKAGATALATSSWSIAASLGLQDGERVSVDVMMATLSNIARSVKLPLTADLETGFGLEPSDVSQTVSKAIQAGIIGFNIEDGMLDGGVRGASDQVDRLIAAREAISASGIPVFLNARIDHFLQADLSKHNELMRDVLDRIQAYARAGADGIFVPGLGDINLIQKICASTKLPINVMVNAQTVRLSELARAGVVRVSYGPNSYLMAMNALEQAARVALSGA